MALILIDKTDNVELVRDQIAAILAAEVINQMALALAAAKDPTLWDLGIYTERSNPWEQVLNANDSNINTVPIVNVHFDNENVNPSKSDSVERQWMEAVYNIDCYGFGLSQVDGAGHKPGDREAVFESQRATRLVRNILMASENTYLGQTFRGVVGGRMIQSITAFQPEIDGRTVQKVMANRISMEVQFNEFSPQVVPETLEFLAIDFKRLSDGKIIVEADYDYTL